MTRTEFNAALRLLHGGKCANCGRPEKKRPVATRRGSVVNVSNLQFHHLDGHEKVGEVTAMPTRASAIKEAAKCALLCTRCHVGYHQCEAYFAGIANDNATVTVANDGAWF